MGERYTNQHGQMSPLSPKAMAQSLTRDAVGCLCGAADAMLQDDTTKVGDRQFMADILASVRSQMMYLGGPEVIFPGQVSLTERDLGADEMIARLRA